jgi:hypothetical protein
MTEETLSKGKKKKKNPKNPTKPKTSLHRPLQALLPLAPRSGRLRGPRPQSPFDPLLGSEPCDPVGGPRLSGVQRSPTFSCWGESSLFVLPAPHRLLRGPSGGVAAWRAPMATVGPESCPASQAWTSRLAGQPWVPGQRGGGALGLHAGSRFSVSGQKKRALCGHSYLFVNIWPTLQSGYGPLRGECLGTCCPSRGASLTSRGLGGEADLPLSFSACRSGRLED